MIKTVVFFSTLMRLARAASDAEASGDPIKIQKAVAEHEAYRQMCLTADEMSIPRVEMGRDLLRRELEELGQPARDLWYPPNGDEDL